MRTSSTPDTPTRRLEFVVFPHFQLLDVTGPIAAFEIASRYRPGAYAIRVVAASPGLVRSSSTLSLHADPFGGHPTPDTLFVVGGEGTRAALQCSKTQIYIKTRAAKARRVASICSGTYFLAAAGLLDGRRATTHWSSAADLARRYPKVRLEPDRIFIRDGRVWSSAGITAGIDLALALIGEDLGEPVALLTARQLVVYYRRPGGQSQFSTLLEQATPGNRFNELLDYIRRHLREPLRVEDLATQAAMSPRNFSRVFQAEMGTGPAKFVQRLRAEAARAALESGAQSVESVARDCGFGDTERMRRTLRRLFGASPATWRRATDPGLSAAVGPADVAPRTPRRKALRNRPDPRRQRAADNPAELEHAVADREARVVRLREIGSPFSVPRSRR